ncbi:uncharacterized protein [Onthophagus taurus]|uniref:uncharacterized protein n=1 Tax=Onthophagus taurus TaxID=166361 RepID=UPI000C1FFEA8|nr:uncharacterized protein LOC111429370 [Onthophagus taurus]
MSKMLITILDKFVYILVCTAITTQALQMVGLIEGPKALGEINYEINNGNYEFGLRMGDEENRGKRHTESNTAIMNNILNLPMDTLQAFENFLKNAKPALDKLHEIAEKRMKQATKVQINDQIHQQQRLIRRYK